MSDQVGGHAGDHGSDHGTNHGTNHAAGSMDIRAQERTFAGFIRIVSWGVGISFLTLIIMALADG